MGGVYTFRYLRHYEIDRVYDFVERPKLSIFN